jgi:MoaA/NifB/PqqE/SkfB family radical SAM enzyme
LKLHNGEVMMSRPNIELKEENEKRLLSEIKSKKSVLTALPPRCTFELSWRCNYNCKKCGYSALERGPEFSAANLPEWEWETVEQIAEQVFPTMKYTESTLLGEPFLSPKFKSLMELYRRHGVYYRPTTNASLLTQDKVELISGVTDWLKCSFDAYNDELYQKLYLNKNYKTVVRNLKNFSEARSHMDPYPWFRVGLVLMRTNLFHLKEYADFVFQELGVDDMEIMCLNYSNEKMVDEHYWDIPEQVNRLMDELVDHCIKNKYRLRLAFTRMPRKDGSWIDLTSEERSREIGETQPLADNSGYEKYSDEVRRGDIFGNREQLEKGYVWSNDMRINRIKADDGSEVGVCEFFTRPFFKPPTKEFDGKDWIKYESCGSCSTFVFGNMREQSFLELYNSPMVQEVRQFLYGKYGTPRAEWMIPCRNCLCVDQIYSFRSNGRVNVGVRYFPGDDLYTYPTHDFSRRLIRRGWDFFHRHGFVATTKMTYRFLKDYYESRRPSQSC